ncbi:MAG: redoxin domain-containing protein [Candidatus Eisenbacteria bacterium]|uniref:Redoxin domain-containing protein n=1 Tax=Eiseniibacteriota bacterium TaxID=2212470 RepID=A0A538UAB0_UNCEI|nr:MAG: redoxin domain-containing protein [Candidatus Eisenbacteria bacterium]
MRMLLSCVVGAALLMVAPAAQAGLGDDGPRRAAPRATAAPGTHAHEAPADDPDSGVELLDTPAPGWTFTRWIGPPLSLAGLRGKVVLLRWWTEDCHYCATTLPELEALRRRHADQGLVVIGVFHPKPPHEVSDRHILAVARKLGFAGPIAVDREWTTLDRYWLAGHPERNWTSVSFLIDRDGVIRWVHGGGEYHPSDDPRHARCALQYHDLEQTLATVLAERPGTSAAP